MKFFRVAIFCIERFELKYLVPVFFGLIFSFANCQALESVVLAAENAFSQDGKTLIKVDPNATSLIIPQKVERISSYAFQRCYSLESIAVEKGNPIFFAVDGVLFSKPEMSLVFYPPARKVEDYSIPQGTVKVLRDAFAHSFFETVEFPASLEEVEEVPVAEAFRVAKGNKTFSIQNGILFGQSGKTLLRYPSSKEEESYTVPKSVVTIAHSAFYGNRNLKSVIFEEGVVTIEGYAFNSCSALESVKLPNSLKTIEMGAFGSCDMLKSFRLPDGVSKIHSLFVVSDRSLNSIEVSEKNKYFKSVDGVLFSKDGSILYCYPIAKDGTSYIAPQGVEKIGDHAFYYCAKLEKVELPEGVRELGNSSFAYCDALREVKLPSTIKSVDTYCFVDCFSLESINLPKNPTSFGRKVFKGCRSLPERFKALDDGEGPAYENPILGENITVVGVDLEGNDVPVDEYLGKVVLVDCWTTWCGFCIAEVPCIKGMYDKYHDKGFEVISYNCDDDLEEIEKFFNRTDPYPWKVVSQQLAFNKTLQSVLEDSGEVKRYVNLMKAYTTSNGYPTMVLIGRDGKVIDKNARGDHLVELLEKEFSGR